MTDPAPTTRSDVRMLANPWRATRSGENSSRGKRRADQTINGVRSAQMYQSDTPSRIEMPTGMGWLLMTRKTWAWTASIRPIMVQMAKTSSQRTQACSRGLLGVIGRQVQGGEAQEPRG